MTEAKKVRKVGSEVMVVKYKDTKAGKYARLSDPSMKSAMADKAKKLSRSPNAALKLLRSAGVATPTGRLAKRFGG
jgi:hypothetical protein